jgi:hypothetical protein
VANPITGGVSLSTTFTQQLDAGNLRLNAYPVPVQPAQQASYGTGTGPLAVQKIAQGGGTTTGGAPTDLDLSTVVCVDGSTGFAHVREVLVFNDDGANPLAVGDDGVVTNAWAAWASGTAARQSVQAGACFRAAKPMGTLGFVVDGTHKVLRLSSGASAVAYRYVIAGD